MSWKPTYVGHDEERPPPGTNTYVFYDFQVCHALRRGQGWLVSSGGGRYPRTHRIDDVYDLHGAQSVSFYFTLPAIEGLALPPRPSADKAELKAWLTSYHARADKEKADMEARRAALLVPKVSHRGRIFED